ncbi:MAG TPA: hypothetical protein VH008_08340 [Pseudonocardia sp.]|nr:hypothetical protein [Pseudonocardia sp.]
MGFIASVGVGLWALAGLIPPPAPSLPPAQIAEFYRHGTGAIRLGLQVSMVGTALLVPFTIVIFLQMRRMEGSDAPWAYLQLCGGIGGMFLFITPYMILQAAIYRVDEISPETLRTLNDIVWIMFVSPFSLFFLQLLGIGMCTLQQRTGTPVFRRWVGYFNLWCALIFCAGFAVPFFKTGPLAWNGVFVWWVPLTVLCVWTLLMAWVVLRAVDQQSRATAPTTVGAL